MKSSKPKVTRVRLGDIADVYNNHWPSADFYGEDMGEVWGDGPEGFFDWKTGKAVPPNPDAMVDLRVFDFTLAWQGNGPENRWSVPATFSALFRNVQRAKTHVRLVVDVPKDRLSSFKDHLGDFDGTLVLE